MSDGNFNRNPNQKPPTVMSEFALRLTGEKLNQESKRPPSLQLNVKRDGKQGPWVVAVEVRTNVDGDKEYGKINLNLDVPTMMMLMDLIQDAVTWPEADVKRMEIHNRRFIRNQNAMSKEPMLDGIVAVGRQPDGQIYLGVKSWDNDRPNCKFLFTPTVDFRRAVKLFHRDGSPWEPAMLSQRYAAGWAKGLTQLLMQVYVSEFTPGEQRQPQNGNGGNGGGSRGWGGNNNGGGGGNRGGQGGGWGGNSNGGQQQQQSSGGGTSAPMDDWGNDIPM